jgi:uncharacterized protein (TIGR02996 family)
VALSLGDLRARPDDRELLLVYGDWLESQGHPRGELIAVQDAERRCASIEEFERARARAVELVNAHAELRPDVAMLDDDRRRLWALWRGGFVRRLEVLIDRPAPSRGEGLRGWSRLLAQILAHPSLALVEEVLIRFDLRGEPLDESEAALTILREGFADWRAEPGPRPATSLALWSSRIPTVGARDRLHAMLPELRPSWYSTDITVFPPPRDSPTTELEGAMARLAPDSGRFDLVWFDTAGRFRDVFGARPREIQPFGSIDPSLRMVVERMGARRRGLASCDEVPQRRIAGIIEALAARLDTEVVFGHPMAPRSLAEPRPTRLDGDRVFDHLRAGWQIDTSALDPALERFAGCEWWWIEDRCAGEPWTGLCGLGDAELLLLTRLAG